MNAAYAPKFHAYKFQEWMDTKYPKIVEKRQLENKVLVQVQFCKMIYTLTFESHQMRH